jgi:hypothetical protein
MYRNIWLGLLASLAIGMSAVTAASAQQQQSNIFVIIFFFIG